MNPKCLFTSDFHGKQEHFQKLADVITDLEPGIVFLGGDILPPGGFLSSAIHPGHVDFIGSYLAPLFLDIKEKLANRAPVIYLIPGNDDPRIQEPSFLAGAVDGAWIYLQNRSRSMGEYTFYGYSFVPPTPFQLKDWERYDVSRFVDVGCSPPTEGIRTTIVPEDDIAGATIQKDLKILTGDRDLSSSVFLFHSPPYNSMLDRAALDDASVDYAPMDVHVGSIAIRRFIEDRRPLITLHGHIHESTRLTGAWREKIGETWCFQAAHDGPETAVIRFSLTAPADAERLLL